MRTGLTRWTGLLFLSVIPIGCALFYKAPSVELLSIDLASLGLSSGVAEVRLEVTNEQSRAMDIRGVLYELEVREPGEDGGWTGLAEGFFDQELSIPGKTAREVVVSVPFEYGGVGAALRSFLAEGRVPYRFRGEIWIGGSESGLQIPFRHGGVIER